MAMAKENTTTDTTTTISRRLSRSLHLLHSSAHQHAASSLVFTLPSSKKESPTHRTNDLNIILSIFLSPSHKINVRRFSFYPSISSIHQRGTSTPFSILSFSVIINSSRINLATLRCFFPQQNWERYNGTFFSSCLSVRSNASTVLPVPVGVMLLQVAVVLAVAAGSRAVT